MRTPCKAWQNPHKSVPEFFFGGVDIAFRNQISMEITFFEFKIKCCIFRLEERRLRGLKVLQRFDRFLIILTTREKSFNTIAGRTARAGSCKGDLSSNGFR